MNKIIRCVWIHSM